MGGTVTDILAVCTGNVCRSPVAEILLRAHLGQEARVTSAGTHAREGAVMPRNMRIELKRDGVDAKRHRARSLTRGMLEDAGLIFTASRRQLRYVEPLAPGAADRAFVLGDLAAVARAGAVLRGDSVRDRILDVPRVAALHLAVVDEADSTDIPDPMGHDQTTYRIAYLLLREMVGDVASWVRGR
ncbi:low molecular weight protein-tyrosine-phosphatase Ptp [Demequina sediminis]|uniref:Low molecular weight protein-tyrosine-phosphatase Ptp n=1 Tax=Demequina sediminis TaxID=1930058 RepID=A0ABP9WKR5_9MICO|nr:protein-tyrosine-phosphatase [Demequina sediminis]